MRIGRFTRFLSVATMVAALFVSGAQAADHGKNAVLQQYSTPKTPAVTVAPATRTTVRPAAVRPTVQRSLPFTGIDLALMSAGGMSLVLFGAGLRRFARNKA